MRSLIPLLLLALIATTPPPLFAEETPPTTEDAEDFEPGALPAALAVLPGLLVHGTGHFVAGDSETGWTLLALEGAGIGSIALGGVLLGFTGGSRYVAGPSIVLIGAGFQLFLASAFADLYGSATGPEGTGTLPDRTPWIDARLGYRHIYDPHFAYSHLAYVEANARYDAWRLTPRAWIALNDNTQRLHTTLAYRALGPTPRPTERTRSFVDVELGMVYHHQATDSFSVLTPELFVHGRLDLETIASSLHGAFAEFGAGIAVEMYDFHVQGLDFASDVNEMLLMRFAFGAAIGEPTDPVHGRFSFYYDHRHDDLTAGLAVGGGAGGPMGHWGADITLFLSPSWGASFLFEVGSAYMTGFDLVYRYGASP